MESDGNGGLLLGIPTEQDLIAIAGMAKAMRAQMDGLTYLEVLSLLGALLSDFVERGCREMDSEEERDTVAAFARDALLGAIAQGRRGGGMIIKAGDNA